MLWTEECWDKFVQEFKDSWENFNFRTYVDEVSAYFLGEYDDVVFISDQPYRLWNENFKLF